MPVRCGVVASSRGALCSHRVPSRHALQIIIGLLFITFNNSKSRATHLGCRLDHDYLLATLSTTTGNLLQTALNAPRTFLVLDRRPMPPRRTLTELAAAGYSVKPRMRDPFTPEQLSLVEDALKRWVVIQGLHCRSHYLSQTIRLSPPPSHA